MHSPSFPLIPGSIWLRMVVPLVIFPNKKNTIITVLCTGATIWIGSKYGMIAWLILMACQPVSGFSMFTPSLYVYIYISCVVVS